MRRDKHIKAILLEARQRAVCVVFDHEAVYPSQWEAIGAIAPKIDCTPETLQRGRA
jgi:hypothetical protein